MRVAFAGGGTGGHLVPGLHLVERARGAEVGGPELSDLLWFTSGRGVEDRVLGDLDPGCEWERVVLSMEPAGGGAPSLTRLMGKTPGALFEARRALRRHRSDVLLGFGGFTALPAALAARSLGVPVALLEINAAPGKATRVLGPLAKVVFHAWRGTLPAAGAGARHRWVGAPVSPQISAVASASEAERLEARAALGFDPARPLLLVLGGSQGAKSLNAFISAHADELSASGVQVLHQCGPGRSAEVARSAPGVRIVEYLAPVASALKAATFVLSRGGASTLAELAVGRRPAIVVPYPHHADRHQERNARELGGGVRVVADDALDGRLTAELIRLVGEGGADERRDMESALEALAPADAALELWRALEDLAARRS